MIDAAACTHHGRQPRLFGPHSRVPPRLTARPPLRHYCVPCTPFWCTTHVPLAHRYIIYYAGRVDEAGSRGRAHTTTAGIPSTDRAAARTPRLPAILSSPPPGYASFDSLFSPLPRTHHRACHRRPDSDRGDTRQQSGDHLSGPEDRPTGLHHAEVRDRGTEHQVHKAPHPFLSASSSFLAREWSDGAQSAIASIPPPFSYKLG